MKQAIGVGFVLIPLCVVFYASFAASHRHNEQQAAERGSLQEQIVCQAQAEKSFNAFMEDYLPVASKNFISHYQPRTRRCFVEIDTELMQSSGNLTTVIRDFLKDAITGEQMGTYFESGYKTVVCSVDDGNGNAKDCKSLHEFVELTSQYMK